MNGATKILVIQTAFIGDVVLATALLERLKELYPKANIDFVLRKGNEAVFANHPFLNRVWIWEKKKNKYRNLLKIISQIRSQQYYLVFNLQRFASTGLLTALSGATITVGFRKNPFSRAFTYSVGHQVGTPAHTIHETERNLALVDAVTGKVISDQEKSKYLTKIYPSNFDFDVVIRYKQRPYVCIAPASVWPTKQFPKEKWAEFIREITPYFSVCLIGSETDAGLCSELASITAKNTIHNLSGKLTFLQSAALMKDAVMNYVNDSAPLHLASGVNAPVAAIFCSTVPYFGFGPTSASSYIIEAPMELTCRPCGLHGKRGCPEKHFNCAHLISLHQLIRVLPNP